MSLSGDVRVAFFGDNRNRLGESPLWDWRRERLWWVDSIEGRIVAADRSGAVLEAWRFEDPVGSIALATDGLLAATADGFAAIDGSGRMTRICRPCAGQRGIRFNDGKADRQGRFVAGTMQVGSDGDPASVWRLGPGGDAIRLDDGMRLVNATCFSPAGDWLYLADSLEGIVRRYPYDPATGTVTGPWHPFIDCNPLGSGPDGATVDRDGRLWVCLVLTDTIACFSPQGDLVTTVELPVPYPSCPAFGGPDLATLYVTTISNSGHRLRTDHQDGGRIVAIDGLNATGLPEAICRIDNHRRN